MRRAMRGGSRAGGAGGTGRDDRFIEKLEDDIVPDINDVLRKNIDLARALYVKEREALELSSLELENVELRRALSDREDNMSEMDRRYALEQRLYADSTSDYSAASPRVPPSALSLRNRQQLRTEDDRAEVMLYQQRTEAYNYLQDRVAKNLARDNRIKGKRNAGPKSPPTWVIKTHPSARKKDNAKQKARASDDAGTRNRSAKRGQNRPRGRGRRARQVDKFDDDGNQARGHFNSIELGFGLQNSVQNEEEDEILARYPISHEFSHLGTQNGHKGASKRGTKKTTGSVFDTSMSDDMILYLARVKRKEDQQAKLRSERLKATAYFSDTFGG